MKKLRGMTAKQTLFVQEYLVDLNATQAAIRAGYKPKNAFQTGAENLKKPKIAELVQEALAERAERTGVTQDMVIEGLLKEAKLYDEDASHGARVTAWTNLGKHLGMFKDKLEVSGKVDHEHKVSFPGLEERLAEMFPEDPKDES